MYPATRSRCRAEISRPMWVPSASGSPATVSMTTVSRCPRNSSTAACSTKTRERAQQSWPELPNAPPRRPSAAAFRSASAKITEADFPPSFRVTRAILSAARRAISTRHIT